MCTAYTSICSTDGSCHSTDEDSIFNMWKERFDKLLNRPSSVSQCIIGNLHQASNITTLDRPVEQTRVISAIRQTKIGNETSLDVILPEICKVVQQVLVDRLAYLFYQIWEMESMPRYFKDAQITSIYKRKVDRSYCNNYRGKSLSCSLHMYH